MRRALASLGAVGVAALLVVVSTMEPSCTTFDGVTVPQKGGTKDAGSEAGSDLPSGFVSLTDAAKVCTQIFKCPQLASSVIGAIAVPLDSLNYSLCMDWLAGPIPSTRVGKTAQRDVFQCIARANTCAEAASCLSYEIIAADDPRCTGAGPDAGTRCSPDGLSVIRCQFLDVLHCQSAYYAPNSKCLPGTDGRHWCGVDMNCPSSDSCIGSLRDYCGTGRVHASINCAAAGYTCSLDQDAGVIDCLTGDQYKTCQTPGTSCDGDIVAVCDGFNVSEFDCASMGSQCVRNGTAARCTRSADTCTPLDSDLNACDGTQISLCVGGKPVSFDCASIGKKCAPAKSSQSGRCE